MLARLALFAVLLAASSVNAASHGRVYAVRWERGGDVTPERRALIEQVDRRLREELRRRGATVVESSSESALIVLTPSLEVLPKGLSLKLVGVRGVDRRVLGAVSMRASGGNRDAVLRAIIARACLEADQLE